MPSNGVAEHRVDAGKSGAGMKGDNKNGREFRENLKYGAHNICCKGNAQRIWRIRVVLRASNDQTHLRSVEERKKRYPKKVFVSRRKMRFSKVRRN